MDVETEKLGTAKILGKKRMKRYVLVGQVAAVVSAMLLMGVVLMVYFVKTTTSGESQITIISRAEWGARPPRSRASMTLPVPYVIIHHSYEPDVCFNRSQCEKYVQGIQNFHMDTRGWDDIGYNFLVGGNGDVFEGRGWDTRGAHAGSMYRGESQITIISRAEWGARPPRSRASMTLPVPYVIIHHSYEPDVCFNRSQCEKYVQGIQNFHMDTRGWDDIGYNFLVGGNGDVFEGRGWDTRGAHAGSMWNGQSIAMMNQTGVSTGPSVKRVYVGYRNKLMSNYTLYGHRQVLPRTCPGEEFYKIVTEWKHWMPGNYTTTSS
uniref:Peptidoglycan recognition protein family domain-containing protein n=1 Tax=Branchiostoma floridae TaxID=7739 RepID=C3ZUT8_BRAFL|eukprot:XP_002587672.1 hypothetical protein BRAFLDRAFT_92716 [Branchiostoma floridae]